MRDKHVRAPWHRAIVVTLGFALLVAACGSDSKKASDAGGDTGQSTTTTPAAKATPVKGGELVFGAESDVSTLDVGAAAQPSDKVITLGLYDPLMSYKDGKLVPYLAESLDSAGEDLATWTMKLRSGVTFHDGTPLNADSIVKHFKRLQDPATGCSCLDLAKIVASMDTPDGVDGLTVVFHLATPSVAFPDLLAGSTGYVESPTAAAKFGAEYKNH
ncbi:MAG: ABC transporter substrate-binding protein, partial [Acidimicrobiales bacterium]